MSEEAKASAESDQIDLLEPTTEEAQVTAEQTQEQPPVETPPAESAAGGTEKDEPNKGFDKIRQQMQQEIGNKIRPLEAKLDQVLQQIEQNGGRATQEQKAQVQNLKDDLDDIGDIDSDSFDPYKATPKIAKVMRERIQKQDARIAHLERQQQATHQAVEPAMRTAYQEQWKGWFKKTNPDLAEKAGEAFEAFERFRSELVDPSEQLPPATMQRIATKAYEQSLKVVSADKPAKPKEVLSSRADKDASGTTVVSSSSAGRSASKTGREKTDKELIEGIVSINTD